ncbi:MAG: hypothetical protein WAV54_10730 [Acidimicrobiales bacterium]
MARPKTFTEPRKATAVRLPEPLHSQLRRVAYERDVSVNHLVIKAVQEWLARHEGEPTQLQLWRSERTEQASNNAPVA